MAARKLIPHRHRVAVIRHALDGHSVSETYRATGVPVRQIRQILTTAGAPDRAQMGTHLRMLLADLSDTESPIELLLRQAARHRHQRVRTRAARIRQLVRDLERDMAVREGLPCLR